MSIVICSPSGGERVWGELLRLALPGETVIESATLSEHERSSVELVVCWNQPEGYFRGFPNLRVVFSTGAGVDHILRDHSLPDRVRVGRIIDPNFGKQAAEYSLFAALSHRRKLTTILSSRQSRTWERSSFSELPDLTAGVMGGGQLGLACADLLASNSFTTRVFRKSKDACGIHRVETDLAQFLTGLDIVVCTLPLTENSAGILNAELFSNLNPGACVINIARGEHLVEGDLLAALDRGQIGSAWLDVFPVEPLPVTSPLWNDPRVFITPHIAAFTDRKHGASFIAKSWSDFGETGVLEGEINRLRGY